MPVVEDSMKYYYLTSWCRVCTLILASLIGSSFLLNVCHAGRISTSGKVYQGIALIIRLNFKPLPEQMPGSQGDTPEMVELGHKLFFERDISLTGSQSCNDCHRLDHQRAGVDNQPTSRGAKGISGGRNSPTVLNAGFQAVQFWDGRSADLVEQAKGPILNPIEMAMRTEEDVINVLKNREDYRRDFERAFPTQAEPVTFDNVARAIAAFERTLITPSRFDRYLEGETEALTMAEKRGLRRFVDTGCIDCHGSYLVGGRFMRKFGVYHPYENRSDLGRYGITGQEPDKFVFKVPSLRNVTLTAPYFHDGRVSTLPEAVRLMAWMQLNKVLSPQEVDEIVCFLHALEAEHPLNVRQP
jgi:cytochrome c peroxidase